MTSELLEKAVRMSVQGHATQKRKDNNSPYIIHPVMVALLLMRHGFSDETVAAGLAHDLIEDTPLTDADLRGELGDVVADIVQAVTNDDSLSWREKKEAYIQTVREASIEAKAVATADKIHNAESLMAWHEKVGPALWERFDTGRLEKLWFEETLLSMLKETWSHPLVEEYEFLVEKMRTLS